MKYGILPFVVVFPVNRISIFQRNGFIFELFGQLFQLLGRRCLWFLVSGFWFSVSVRFSVSGFWFST